MMTLSIIIVLLYNLLIVTSQNIQPFSYVGGNQLYTVPSNVNLLYVQLWGAGGAGGYYSQTTVYNYGGGILLIF